MIDFDALVLGPCVDIFARPITVTPVASQPERYADDGVTLIPAGLPYAAQGVWASRPVDVQTEQGIMSSQVHTLGIRASEFAFPPGPGDLIEIDAYLSSPRVGLCEVEDGDDDGQGGTSLSLKIIGP